jgi:hypothetical protein
MLLAIRQQHRQRRRLRLHLRAIRNVRARPRVLRTNNYRHPIPQLLMLIHQHQQTSTAPDNEPVTEAVHLHHLLHHPYRRRRQLSSQKTPRAPREQLDRAATLPRPTTRTLLAQLDLLGLRMASRRATRTRKTTASTSETRMEKERARTETTPNNRKLVLEQDRMQANSSNLAAAPIPARARSWLGS